MAGTSETRVRVILNPAAGGGSALKKVPLLGEALRRYELRHEIVLTKTRGHAAELARAAISDGVDVIAVVGGDGTMNEVVQAFLKPDGTAAHGPDLAVIPSGTGGDFIRTIGMSGAIDEAVARIRFGARRAVDLGVLSHRDHAGGEKSSAFLNIASFGLGGVVDSIINRSPKWLGGRGSFFVATLRGMVAYENADVRVKVDGATWFEGRVVNVAIANGRYFGGGMMIAPHADPSDGRFEVVAVGDMSRREVVGLTGKIYKGAHLGEDGIRVTHGVRIEAEPVEPWSDVLIDLDGEQPGKLPARATILPAALQFRV